MLPCTTFTSRPPPPQPQSAPVACIRPDRCCKGVLLAPRVRATRHPGLLLDVLTVQAVVVVRHRLHGQALAQQCDCFRRPEGVRYRPRVPGRVCALKIMFLLLAQTTIVEPLVRHFRREPCAIPLRGEVELMHFFHPDPKVHHFLNTMGDVSKKCHNVSACTHPLKKYNYRMKREKTGHHLTQVGLWL